MDLDMPIMGGIEVYSIIIMKATKILVEMMLD